MTVISNLWNSTLFIILFEYLNQYFKDLITNLGPRPTPCLPLQLRPMDKFQMTKKVFRSGLERKNSKFRIINISFYERRY